MLMPPLTYISAFRRTDANGGSRGEAMPERENAKIVNAGQKVAQILGHSKDLITLSQVLTYSSSHIIKKRGRSRQVQRKPRAERSLLQLCRGAACTRPTGQVRLFLLSRKFWSSESKGKLVCTLPSRDKTRPKVKGGRIVFLSPATKIPASRFLTILY